MAHPFQALIIKVDMGNLHLVLGERVHIHAKPVILGGDLHPSIRQVLDGLVRPPVAEFQLVCFPSHGQAQELVSQADAKNWLFSQKGLHSFDGVR